MPPISNHAIDNYIHRVTELSQSGERIPTSEELEQIVADLGITPEEIKAAQQQSQDHFIRAQGYLRLKHWDDAIEELQEAVAFNPFHLDMITHLATAHMGRWQQKKTQEEENNVKARIRQCLAIKPDHEEALNLISKLDRAIDWRKRIRIILAIGLGIILMGFGSVFLFRESLSYLLLNRTSELEQLESRLMKEIQLLKQEQEGLKAEILAIRKQDNQRSQTKFTELQQKIQELEDILKVWQIKIRDLESGPSVSPSPTQKPIVRSLNEANRESSP